MTEFTKGPWRKDGPTYSEENDQFCINIVGGDGDEMPTWYAVSSYIWGTQKEKAEANAHLIAASPDLYEALEKLLALCGGVLAQKLDDPSRIAEFPAIINAHAALDKARGDYIPDFITHIMPLIAPPMTEGE